MIDSNLAVLLAERNLKITRVSRDTGISRTTLTALCNDYTAGIKFDTLNILCKYLRVSPEDFFNYTPYDYEVMVYEDESSEPLDKLQSLSENIERIYDVDVTITKHNHKWVLPLNILVQAFDTVPFSKIAMTVLLSEEVSISQIHSIAYDEFGEMIKELTPRQVDRFKSDIKTIMEERIKSFLSKKYDVSEPEIYTEDITHSCIFNFMD